MLTCCIMAYSPCLQRQLLATLSLIINKKKERIKERIKQDLKHFCKHLPGILGKFS